MEEEKRYVDLAATVDAHGLGEFRQVPQPHRYLYHLSLLTNGKVANGRCFDHRVPTEENIRNLEAQLIEDLGYTDVVIVGWYELENDEG